MARFKVTHYDGTKSAHSSLDSAKKAAKKKLKDYMEPGDGLQVWSVNKKTVGMAVSSGGELTDEQSFIVQEGVVGLENFRAILSENAFAGRRDLRNTKLDDVLRAARGTLQGMAQASHRDKPVRHDQIIRALNYVDNAIKISEAKKQ